jgi:hypothetical protein
VKVIDPAPPGSFMLWPIRNVVGAVLIRRSRLTSSRYTDCGDPSSSPRSPV